MLLCIYCRKESETPFCFQCVGKWDVQNRFMKRAGPSWLREQYEKYWDDFPSMEDAELFLSSKENGTIANLNKVIRFAFSHGYELWYSAANPGAKRLCSCSIYCEQKGERAQILTSIELLKYPSVKDMIIPGGAGVYFVEYKNLGYVRDEIVHNIASVIIADDNVRKWVDRGNAGEHDIVMWAPNDMKTRPLVVNRGQIVGGRWVSTKDGPRKFEDVFTSSVSGDPTCTEYGNDHVAPASLENLESFFTMCKFYTEEGIAAALETLRLLNRDEWIHKGLIWRRMTELYDKKGLHRFIYDEGKELGFDPFNPFAEKLREKIPVEDLEEWERYLNGMRPFSQQKIAAELAYRIRHIGYWMDMRVGKTPTSMMVARRMLLEKHVDQVFFVAPAVNVYDPWVKELEKQGWFRVVVLDEGSKTDEINLSSGIPNAFVVSYDTLLTRQHMIAKYIDLMRTGWVFDETSLVKNHSSKRAKVSVDMTEHAVFTLCLNGTPMAQGPQDIWPQQYIYDRGVTWGVKYKSFENEWLRKAGVGNKLSVARGKEMFFELAISSTSVRYLRSEADQFSGRDKNFRYVVVPPTDQMVNSTQEILAGFTTASGEMTDIKQNILVVYGHLREACAGYDKYEILKDSGKYRRVRHEVDPKVTWLKVFLKANPGQPVICFTEFSESEDIIMEMLEAEGYEYAAMREKYSKSPRTGQERSEQIRRFQEGDAQVFIMKSTQAKGVTLNRIPAVQAGIGSYPVIVYFQPSWSLVDFEQSQDRAVGTDPKTNKSISTMIYFLIIRKSIEAEIVKALRKKKNVAETLLADAERNGYVNPFSEMDMTAGGNVDADEVFDAHEYQCRYDLEIGPGKKLTKRLLDKQLKKTGNKEAYDYLLDKAED